MYFSSNATGEFQLWRQRFPDGGPDQLTFGPTTAEGLIFAAREERLEPGAGELDLAGVLRALPADVAIAVEIPNSKLQAQMTDEERAKRALQSTKALVEEVRSTRAAAGSAS